MNQKMKKSVKKSDEEKLPYFCANIAPCLLELILLCFVRTKKMRKNNLKNIVYVGK